MKTQAVKESAGHRQRGARDRQLEKESLHGEPAYRHGYAVEDWVEADREILGPECGA